MTYERAHLKAMQGYTPGQQPDTPAITLNTTKIPIRPAPPLREWRRRRMARRELASLDERTIRDIGLDPGVVDYEARQSFWRPFRDWRN